MSGEPMPLRSSRLTWFPHGRDLLVFDSLRARVYLLNAPMGLAFHRCRRGESVESVLAELSEGELGEGEARAYLFSALRQLQEAEILLDERSWASPSVGLPYQWLPELVCRSLKPERL